MACAWNNWPVLGIIGLRRRRRVKGEGTEKLRKELGRRRATKGNVGGRYKKGRGEGRERRRRNKEK